MNIADRFTLHVLRQRPATSEQLAIECGMSRDSMRVVMSRLHKNQQVHVGSWYRIPTGQLKGIWEAGPGEDAPKPVHPTCTRKRHPSIAQIQAITAGVPNPFATAMWNVERAAR